MFEFLNSILTEGAKNQLKETYDFQVGCDFLFMESVDIHKLDITYFRNSINVYMAQDTDGLCKDVHFYSDSIIIRTFSRLESGTSSSAMNKIELSYASTEEELFQMSTVQDMTGIDLDTMKLFCTIRDTYVTRSKT